MDKKQLTVRLPQPIFDYLSERSAAEHKSMNDIITDIAETYMKWREGERTLNDIALLRERAKGETGVQPDSTDDIRRLREGER
jgi:hypothetical protein